jgi:hypothetical protein
MEEDLNCTTNPLFLTVPQQGPFLKYYRNKDYPDFKISNYVIALLD